MRSKARAIGAIAGTWCALAILAPAAAVAQAMPGMDMPANPGPSPTPPAEHYHTPGMDMGTPATAAPPADHQHMPGMDMSAHDASGGDAGAGMAGMSHGAGGMGSMLGLLGNFSMTREGSGTSWQPENSPMYGVPIQAGAWTLMAQGFLTGVYDRQGGPRGDTKAFSESMAMLMARRPVGAGGVVGLRAMLSLDPLMGRSGYPLLFATGETADGRTELVDRQHPHDLFMELAASYAQDVGGGTTLSIYGGLPGEPALGPPTFMHRISGMDNPEAPIGHHWFDSTHITYGVVTLGLSRATWKIEASAFKGREPDQFRYGIESPKLDSWAVRATWNPTANLSAQVSTGHLKSPEQLHPDEDEQRTTASVTYNRPLGGKGNWATTIAWSLKDQRPGPSLHGLLAETSLRFADRHIVFARAEHEDESELFGEESALHHDIVKVAKLSLGYAYEVPLIPHARLAVGGLASAFAFPRRIVDDYGSRGVKSFMLFTRLRLAD